MHQDYNRGGAAGRMKWEHTAREDNPRYGVGTRSSRAAVYPDYA